MKRQLSVIVALGVTCSLAWALVAAAPPVEPIVLSYSDTPIFLGPHEHWIQSLAFSPDGKTLATGSADGHLRLWDAATGRLKSIDARDETRGINGVAYSPDGKQLAIVGGFFARDAVLCDAQTGQYVRTLDEPAPPSNANLVFVYKGKPIDYRSQSAVAISPDGKLLATAPYGVLLRDLASGKLLATLNQPAKGVKSVVFSPDGKTLITASDDKKVRLWSVPDGALQATLGGPTQPLESVAISPDGARIVATSSGNRTILDQTPVGNLWSWDQPSGPPRKIELGKVRVGKVVFAGPTTVVVGAGNEVRAIDLVDSSSTPVRKVTSMSSEVAAVTLSGDGKLLACGGRDRSVDVVDFSSGKLLYRLPGLIDQISAVAVTGDGSRFASSTIDRRMTNPVLGADAPFAQRFKTHFSNDANASRVEPSEVRVWSSRDGRLERLLELPLCQVIALDFAAEHQLVVAGWRHDGTGLLGVWDCESGKRLRELGTHAAEVLAISVSPDGQALVSGDAEGNLDWWNLKTGERTRHAKHDHAIEAVVFSNDGERLAVGLANRTVHVLDNASGTLTCTLTSRSAIETLDFSPDGSRLAAGTRDPGLELWDLGSTAASRTLKSDGDHFDTMPGFVAFSPDGRFVVCGGHGKDIAVFDVASATMHCELRGHAHPATSAAFFPDGRLLSGGDERTVRVWDINKRALQATWLAVPADAAQGWTDQWVGYKPSGEFVSSTPSDRLVGWLSGGDKITGQEDPPRRRRVESLFGDSR